MDPRTAPLIRPGLVRREGGSAGFAAGKPGLLAGCMVRCLTALAVAVTGSFPNRMRRPLRCPMALL